MLGKYIETLGGFGTSSAASFINIFIAFALEIKVAVSFFWIPLFFIGGWRIPKIIIENWYSKTISAIIKNYDEMPANQRGLYTPAWNEKEKKTDHAYKIQSCMLVVSRIMYLFLTIPTELYILDMLPKTWAQTQAVWSVVAPLITIIIVLPVMWCETH